MPAVKVTAYKLRILSTNPGVTKSNVSCNGLTMALKRRAPDDADAAHPSVTNALTAGVRNTDHHIEMTPKITLIVSDLVNILSVLKPYNLLSLFFQL